MLVQGKSQIIKQQQDYDDSADLRNRMKVLMGKFNNIKKEKEMLQKENQNLQQEIFSMQSHLRSMISGFANTGSTFPMINELQSSVAEFYKCECFDIFFDVLCPELNMKGIVFFFSNSMQKIQKLIDDYFQPSFQQIKIAGCFDSIEGPIMNVLRKSFQTNHQQIEQMCLKNVSIVRDEIQKHLKLGNEETNCMILKFVEKLGLIMLNCQICDPPLNFKLEQIGTRVQFNQAKFDPIDGFIKIKEECIVLLPNLMKGEEMINKAVVISATYQFDNE